MCLILGVGVVCTQAEAYTGSCGDNATYNIDTETGLLTISGSGEIMEYFFSNNVPWQDKCSYIKTIIITNGITSIGFNSFVGCHNLTSVTIPNSLTSIGGMVFYACENLTDIYYSGTEAEWIEITIGEGNTYLTNAMIHFVEDESDIPDTEGKTPEIGYTTFTFTPVGVSEGDIIAILTVKDGVSTSYAKTYSGSGTVTFEIENGFNSMKILVWDSYESMQALMEYAKIE